MLKKLNRSDLTIVIDSREQTPLAFGEGVQTVRGSLKTGDYSVRGFEDIVCIERKSLQDLVQCVGRERGRFERCLDRMRQYAFAAVVVECGQGAVELQQYRGEVSPNSVMGSIYSWRASGVAVYFEQTREQAARATEAMLWHAVKNRTPSEQPYTPCGDPEPAKALMAVFGFAQVLPKSG